MKGATKEQDGTYQNVDISIHAPVKGATQAVSFFSFASTYFNPRTREGCDVLMSVFLTSFFYFNPRTREGCDISVLVD